VGIKAIDFSMAIDDNSEECALVMVDNAKYILNYWPDTVISNKLKDFKVVQKLDLQTIIKKIGRT
jgi:DnaJ-domain-containing protein 1